ncbi:uncharacterized protein LOC135485349 isoform X1 [Lineus longissimus]|uniref:uncharacterized protein LOC135485349 isoform X1 n=1 Tax=Lineus longissimus TaxID=88925 RepID=UPI00315CA55D
MENTDPLPASFLTYENEEHLVIPTLKGFTTYHVTQCRKLRNRPIVFETFVRRALKKLLKRYVEMSERIPMYSLLPDLTQDDILYPTRHIVQFNQLKFHFLCPVKDGMHFINAQGLPLVESRGEVLSAMMSLATLCNVILLDQKVFIPNDVGNFVKTKEDIPPNLLDAGLRRILYMAICTFSMLHKDVLEPILSGSVVMRSPQFSKMIVTVMKVTEEMITKKGDVTGLGTQMIFNKDAGQDKQMWNCPGHAMSKMTNMGIDSFPIDIFKPYLNVVTRLNVSSNNFETFPGIVFEKFTGLTDVDLSHNKLTSLPANIDKAETLISLNVSHNQLTILPTSIKDLKSLTYLNVSSNPLMTLQKEMYEVRSLCLLDLGNTGLVSLGENIAKLSNLHVLLLSGLGLKTLPANFSVLTKLTKLDLSGIKWFDAPNRNSILTRTSFDEFLETNILLKAILKTERDSMFSSFDKGHKGNLDYDDIQVMNTKLFQMFGRFQSDDVKVKNSKASGLGGFPEQLLQLTKLEHLLMSYQGLSSVPDRVNAFKTLKFLDVSHNPKLEYVSAELGAAPLEGLFLKGCPSLKTPPREIVSKGFKVTHAYLKRLQTGSVSCKRTKLMMVGLGGAGKTSLVKSLTANQLQKESQGTEMITDGIDITNWKIREDGSDEELTFSVWDFAGQTVYYNTHQFFLSNRAVYLLLWNVRLGYEHAGLDFWCSSIACHAPKAPILVVGSHVDKVEKPELPEESMRKRYPQIKGFHYVSSATGRGLKELAENLTQITKQEKYMGEMIPEAWLNLEKKILNERSKASLLPWDKVASFATETGIINSEEISNAVQFLHDLGSLQHFTNDRLKSRVVINPQWIVDVMACVVSVHSSPIKQGLFYKKDMSIIWKDYPVDLHPWLLNLTEEFDLTFPLTDKDANLVPCLLPEKEPKYVWPDVTEKVGRRETKMFYKFEYLPVGLFNRAQVRLYQFSDQSVIWRKGSLLRKNNHLALVAQTSDSELKVKVQGPRPENILFLIHEVFESLIAESFHGVQYDYFVPCTDCIMEGSLDPCMFSASKIRRAMEFKAPFLQCDKYFHMLTMTELLAMKPPESGSDYDAHLEKTAHDLRNLKQTMSKQIVIYYCTANSPRSGQDWPGDVAHPRQIRDDLSAAGFKLWVPDNPTQLMLDQFTITLKHAQLIIVCMSNEFEADKKCVDLLHYIKEILKKKILVVCVGANYAWQKTSLGLYTASEVYVNMTKGKPYKEKVEELKEAIMRKLGNVKKAESFDCFLSYCWGNSHHAVKLGHGPEALGWGDPREVKDYLEKNGVHCWMDIERTGVGGLFEDIGEGLRHSKVMVACISEEYVKSRNCLMEFQFAKVTLRLPIVVAVFGSGTKWETSELGMLSLGHDRVDFQHENPTGHQRLLAMVKEKLPKDAGNGEQTIDDVENQQISYHELLELGQRKFLRQVTLYADSMDTSFFPRLTLVDILPIDQTPPAETDQQPASSGDENQEKEVPVDEKTQEEVFKDPSTGAYRLCFKLLCENEDGWHVVEPSIPCTLTSKLEQDKFLLSIAPYLIRILAVLKHSTLNLNMILTSEGDELVQNLQEKIATESSDFREQYMILRKAVIAQDEEEVMGNMNRCGLPSRKVIWLCKEHQEANRVVVLDKDDAGVGLPDTEDDAILVEQLQQHHEVLIKDIDAARQDAMGQNRGKLVESVLAANIGVNNAATSQICTIS